MKKIIIQIKLIFALFSYALVSYGGLGPIAQTHTGVDGICLITFKQFKQNDLVDELCTGIVVSNNHILTAAHCIENQNIKLNIKCGSNKQTILVDKIIVSKKFNVNQVKNDESSRRFDWALIESKYKIHSKKVELSNHHNELLKIKKSNRSRCALFGYSHMLNKPYTSLTHPSPILIDPHLIEDHTEQPFTISGVRGAGFLVEPGDSGGALACQHSELEPWKVFGITSGRDLNYTSMFAPVYLNPEINLNVLSIEESAEFNNYLDIQDFNFKKSNLINEVLKQKSKLETMKLRFGEYYTDELNFTYETLSTLNLAELKNKLLENKQLFINWIMALEKPVIRIKPYSQLRVLDEGIEETKSLLDHIYNQFKIISINENEAMGELTLLNSSERFLCIDGLLCSAGTYKSVIVKIDDFEIYRVK